MKTFCIKALGCDKNIIDAEQMAQALIDAGYVPVTSIETAEIVVVHTCAFIQEAKEESIQAILEAERDKKDDARLVVSGCLAQRYWAELSKEMPEVDLFLGVGRQTRIDDILGEERVAVGAPGENFARAASRIPSTPPWYAFVKVSEGCNNRCAYCVIPSIRGGLVSRPVEDIIGEINLLVDRGMVELNLIAQDLTAYGTDTIQGGMLVELLKAITERTRVPWIRLLYLHPKGITNSLIDLMADEKRILPYADIPIQHINDGILRSMGRKIVREDIESLILKMREKIDDLVIRTSLIVGFPGEGEREFEELHEFVARVKFNHLGVFCWSREEGTAAASLPGRVPKKMARARRDQIMSLQQEISLEHNRKLVGSETSVLLDGPTGEDGAVWWGRFFGQAPEVDGIVIVEGLRTPGEGTIIKAKITDALDYDLVALSAE